MTMSLIRVQILYSVIFGIISSILLIGDFKHSPDFSLFLVFITALIGNIVFIKLQHNHIVFNIVSKSLIISYVLLCLGFIINTKGHLLNVFLLVVLYVIISLNLLSQHYSDNLVFRYISFFSFYVSAKFDGLNDVMKDMKTVSHSTDTEKISKKLKSIPLSEIIKVIVIFILVGIPILFVVSALLSSTSSTFSNWVFDDILGSIGDLFNFNLNLSSFTSRLIIAVTIAGFVLTEFAVFKRFIPFNEKVAEQEYKISLTNEKRLGIVLVVTMILLNVLYIIFTIAQLKYDLGNLKEYVSENDISSYSELAVSRFWELILVSVINLLLLYFSRKSFQLLSKKNEYFKYTTATTLILFCLSSLLLIFSTHQRLYFYISSYGFTYRRFGSYTFLPILIAVTLLIVLTHFARNHRRYHAYIISILAIYFSAIIALPTTYIVNRINFELATNGSIEVVDPIYTIQYNRETFPMGDYAYNAVTDYDGLLVAEKYLHENDLISRQARKDLAEYLKRFYKENKDTDIREFNLMRWLIMRNE